MLGIVRNKTTLQLRQVYNSLMGSLNSEAPPYLQDLWKLILSTNMDHSGSVTISVVLVWWYIDVYIVHMGLMHTV